VNAGAREAEARSVSSLATQPVQPGGNVYDKYGTANPIERRLVGGFIRNLLELAEGTGARDVHEVGCGEGELARRLAARGLSVRGTDASPEVIAEARRRAVDAGVRVELRAAAVEELDPERDAAELVVCCEVLEHLPDPEAGLTTVAELANPWAIVSVPREPLWRALNVVRLKYLNDLGNTPGHVKHWSRRAFVAFLGRRLDVVEVRSPLPWTMALCRSRDRQTPDGGFAA
jgi:2-polyprenyl-3-methyl-5-hydroxy-6-metoxy-1,4-benzoquinol methylase